MILQPLVLLNCWFILLVTVLLCDIWSTLRKWVLLPGLKHWLEDCAFNSG